MNEHDRGWLICRYIATVAKSAVSEFITEPTQEFVPPWLISSQTHKRIYRVAQKIGTIFYALTSSNINRISQLFYCQYCHRVACLLPIILFFFVRNTVTKFWRVTLKQGASYNYQHISREKVSTDTRIRPGIATPLMAVHVLAKRPLRPNVTSSIKPEVHNVAQRRRMRTEPRPQGIRIRNFVLIGPAVPQIRSRTDRQMVWSQYTAPLPGRSNYKIPTQILQNAMQSGLKYILSNGAVLFSLRLTVTLFADLVIQ